MPTAARLALLAALPLVAAGPAPASDGCGPGALALPGTSACVRLAGSARAEAAAGRPPAIAPPAAGAGRRSGAAFAARGRADVDARAATAYGPVRAYLSVEAGRAR